MVVCVALRCRPSDTALGDGLWQLPRERAHADLDVDHLGEGDAGARRPVQLSPEQCRRAAQQVPGIHDVRVWCAAVRTEILTGLLRVADGLGSLLQVRIHD